MTRQKPPGRSSESAGRRDRTLDLDELERRVRTIRGPYRSTCDAEKRDVLIALIARVRDLERALVECADMLACEGGRDEQAANLFRAVADRGVVLP